jgi:hypothetical protein
MKASGVSVLLLLLTVFAISQTTTKSAYDDDPPDTSAEAAYSPQLRSELAALRDAALGDEYAYRQLAHLTENIGARPSGSAQAEAAANYVADELRKLGLEVHLEEALVPHWVRGVETAELVEYPGQVPGTTQRIVLTALGGNAPTPPAGITAEVIVVTSFDELKTLGRDKVAGKIVLFNTRYDVRQALANYSFEAYEHAVLYRGKGAKEAAALGAVGSLVRSVGDADFRLPHAGGSTAAGIPAGAVTAEDADLIAYLAGQGRVRIHVTLTGQNQPPVIGHNVVADLKGSEHPEQIVVVSGHLDSWDLGTGAIDDACGVVIAMETAELLQRLHLHPKRTLRVIAWTDEENGGKGHEAYAKDHAAEFANHVGAIESDSGAGHPLGFSAKISAGAFALLRPMQEILAPVGANLMEPSNDSPGSDISPLAKAGVPSFGMLPDGRTYFHYHHTAADTLDKVAPQDVRENAAAMAVLAYTLASLPEPLPR